MVKEEGFTLEGTYLLRINGVCAVLEGYGGEEGERTLLSLTPFAASNFPVSGDQFQKVDEILARFNGLVMNGALVHQHRYDLYDDAVNPTQVVYEDLSNQRVTDLFGLMLGHGLLTEVCDIHIVGGDEDVRWKVYWGLREWVTAELKAKMEPTNGLPVGEGQGQHVPIPSATSELYVRIVKVVYSLIALGVYWDMLSSGFRVDPLLIDVMSVLVLVAAYVLFTQLIQPAWRGFLAAVRKTARVVMALIDLGYQKGRDFLVYLFPHLFRRRDTA